MVCCFFLGGGGGIDVLACAHTLTCLHVESVQNLAFWRMKRVKNRLTLIMAESAAVSFLICCLIATMENAKGETYR